MGSHPCNLYYWMRRFKTKDTPLPSKVVTAWVQHDSTLLPSIYFCLCFTYPSPLPPTLLLMGHHRTSEYHWSLHKRYLLHHVHPPTTYAHFQFPPYQWVTKHRVTIHGAMVQKRQFPSVPFITLEHSTRHIYHWKKNTGYTLHVRCVILNTAYIQWYMDVNICYHGTHVMEREVKSTVSVYILVCIKTGVTILWLHIHNASFNIYAFQRRKIN